MVLGIPLAHGNRPQRHPMIEDCVIVGGGVAGLSAANQLADAGLNPLIIEASKFPAHRICGEFLSHECLPILHRWDIPVSGQIDLCRFFSGTKKVEFQLPVPSGSCSRYNLDSMLLERAKSKGARALTETAVASLRIPRHPSANYELSLSNGQTIQSRHLIIGTGRIPRIMDVDTEKTPCKYMGFKAHFEGINLDSGVEIHSFAGGYVGVSKVDSKTTNIACIVKMDHVEKLPQPETFMLQLQKDGSVPAFKKKLANAQMIFPNWLIGRVPEFGIRSNPSWERVFWIGDAAGSIPPVCGDGLGIAVTSGCMAADYFLKFDAIAFKKAWLKRYKRRFFGPSFYIK